MPALPPDAPIPDARQPDGFVALGAVLGFVLALFTAPGVGLSIGLLGVGALLGGLLDHAFAVAHRRLHP